MAHPICLELTEDEALVLFDILQQFEKTNTLAIRDLADERALWNLQTELQKQMANILFPDYAKLLDIARNRLCNPAAQSSQIYRMGTSEEIWEQMSKRIKEKVAESLSVQGVAPDAIARYLNKVFKEKPKKSKK